MQNHSSKFKIFGLLGLAAIVLVLFLYMVPAFRGDIEVSPGFTIFGMRVRYYGLLLASAVLLCWSLALKFAKRFDLEPALIENALFWTVVGGPIGARTYVVVFNWDYFRDNLGEVYKIWHGGLAIYGGLAGGFIVALIYAKRNHLVIWKLLDLLALVVPLGQAIGRFGNFFNQEAFGPPTKLPWKMYVSPLMRPPQFAAEIFFHPTFFYEFIWNLLVFGILLYLVNGKRSPGFIFFTYLASYSFGRFFLEYLRIDSQRVFSWRLNQIVSVIVFAAAAGVLTLMQFKSNAKGA